MCFWKITSIDEQGVTGHLGAQSKVRVLSGRLKNYCSKDVRFPSEDLLLCCSCLWTLHHDTVPATSFYRVHFLGV